MPVLRGSVSPMKDNEGSTPSKKVPGIEPSKLISEIFEKAVKSKTKKIKDETKKSASKLDSNGKELKNKKRKSDPSSTDKEGKQEVIIGESSMEKPKIKKKRKAENGEAVKSEVEQALKGPKSTGDASPTSSETSEEANPLIVDNFPISENVKTKLLEKGIKALFPIQAETFEIIFEGFDLVGRARTGQGKTLAFVLPIVERILAKEKEGDSNSSVSPGRRRTYARLPRVIVLTPTRELAKQVGADFEWIGQSVGLSCVCVYGGAAMATQENLLRRGVDVVVGTPGRIKDLMERGSLQLKECAFRVLDEADEMLNMGFVEDVETILSAVDVSQVQTLLFSATMPEWVQKIANRFLRSDRSTVDLVGNEKLKASENVKHLLLPCHWSQRNKIVTDVIQCYGKNGRVIVFTETKNDASELTQALSNLSARALHGDIPQGQREATLQSFRAGKFSVLVATDVAARGLDINDVTLVIQSEPPRTEETYIHRSGRTGRAGKTGVSVMLVTPKKEYMVRIIERKAGFTFQRIASPQPADVAKASANTALEALNEVSNDVIPLFREVALQLVQNHLKEGGKEGGGEGDNEGESVSGSAAVEVLAKALAKISGHTTVQSRSLLSAHEDSTTMLFQSDSTIRTPSFVFSFLRRILQADESRADEVRRMTLTKDGMGAVFDVPSKMAKDFIKAYEEDGRSASSSHTKATLSIATSLPELQFRAESGSGGAGGSYGSRNGSGGGGGGWRGGRGGANGSSPGRSFGNRSGSGGNSGGFSFGGRGRGGRGGRRFTPGQ